jgi:dTDP-4-amino-4,6-dideoxygalactose transaminase
MWRNWTPHPRYRLYTFANSYFGLFFEASDQIAKLESEVSQRFSTGAAVCVPMARAGLLLTLNELIRPGQKVLMSPFTIVDVVNAVLFAGGIPEFVDIDRQTCSIDPNLAESRIDGRTGAIILTHLHGRNAGAKVFRDICDRRRIPLIEDAAQAFGAVENGRRLGTIGDAGVYSFGFFKNVNGWRGGMVVSHDLKLIERIRCRVAKMKQFGRASLLGTALKGLAVDLATWPPMFSSVVHPLVRIRHQAVARWIDPERNEMRAKTPPPDYFRAMRAAQASLCLNQLSRVDLDSAARVERASFYDGGLKDVYGVTVPPLHRDLSHIYTYYPIQCQQRDGLLDYAQHRGRDCAAGYLRNCADLSDLSEFHRSCPNARKVASELVLLPTYPRYPISEVRKNCDVIAECLRRAHYRTA